MEYQIYKSIFEDDDDEKDADIFEDLDDDF